MLKAAQAASTGLNPAWLTLNIPAGWQKPNSGMSPGSRGPARPFWAGTGHEGDVQGWLKGTEGGTVPAALASREACFIHHLLGSARERPASSRHWGINSHLSQLFLHSEVSQYLQRSQKQTEPHLIPPQEPPSSFCSPSCIPRARRQCGEVLFLAQTRGQGATLPNHFYFLFLHICPLPLPSGRSWASVFIKRGK